MNIMKNIIELDTGTRQLLSHIHGTVGIITLNRPEAKNALSDELTPALRKQIKSLDKDNRVNVLIITGAGDSFCAGGDVKSMNSSINTKGGWNNVKTELEVIKDLQNKQMTLTHVLYNFSKPTIAMLPGAAAGAGLSIALTCDFRYVNKNAFAIAGYGKIALTGDYGISWLLPKIVGISNAKNIMFSNKRVSALEGLNIGLFDKIIEENNLLKSTLEFANVLSSFSPLALKAMKNNIQNYTELTLEESLLQEATVLINTSKSNDHKEGIKAFVEKRKPIFTGT
jgi:enoyl-CoA hydratase/carnithine racemase